MSSPDGPTKDQQVYTPEETALLEKYDMKKDVLFGTGGKANEARSGSFFRKLIEELWPVYCSIGIIGMSFAQDKRDFVHKRIIQPIADVDGMFLEVSKKNGVRQLFLSNPQDKVMILKKIENALRDEMKRFYKGIERKKGRPYVDDLKKRVQDDRSLILKLKDIYGPANQRVIRLHKHKLDPKKAPKKTSPPLIMPKHGVMKPTKKVSNNPPSVRRMATLPLASNRNPPQPQVKRPSKKQIRREKFRKEILEMEAERARMECYKFQAEAIVTPIKEGSDATNNGQFSDYQTETESEDNQPTVAAEEEEYMYI